MQDAETFHLSKGNSYAQLGNVAMVYESLGQDKQAMDVSLRAIKLQEQYRLIPRYANTYATVGHVLKKMGKPEQALPYIREALSIEQESNNLRGIAIAENQLGSIYHDLHKPEEALRHYRSSLKIAEQIGYELQQTDGLINIARMMDQLKRPAEGLPYAFKALRISETQQNKEAMATANSNIGILYQSLKEYAKAEMYQKKSLILAQQLNDQASIKKYTQGLADFYAEQQMYQQAYAFQLQKNRLIDSATAIRTNAEVQRLLAQYQTEKKEAQIKLLRKEKQLEQQATERAVFQNNALIVGGLLILLLGAAVSAWLLNRARLRRLEEAQRLRQQIAQDLHDEVGSTLSSISLLSGHTDRLLSENRPESAQRMVQKIYTDARQILESIDEIIWTINPGNDSLQRVIQRLREYAQPLMESRGIAFVLTSDSVIDELPVSMDVRRNLYLIGKEAINNLVKYSDATQATVRFERKDNQLQVIIEDNGRGFDTAQETKRTGQRSMQQRAWAMDGRLTIASAPGQGTTLQLVVGLGV